jgi:hypothetical protein
VAEGRHGRAVMLRSDQDSTHAATYAPGCYAAPRLCATIGGASGPRSLPWMRGTAVIDRDLVPTCAGVAGALIVGRPAHPGSSPAPAFAGAPTPGGGRGAHDPWREAEGGRRRQPSACLSPLLGYYLIGDPPAALCASDILFRDCQVDNST